MGPLMIDVQGTTLSPKETKQLAHPLVGGVILFRRNYQGPEQLAALVKAIRTAAKAPILIAVDHEGGRVQRFLQGFTRLPAMAQLASQGDEAESLAQDIGLVMAVELKQLGVDMSFAPVLDVQRVSTVIGDRAFGQEPTQVIRLATALCRGMHFADMPTTGKHFPGHGGVEADSHIAIPVDPRPLTQISEQDMCVFAALMRQQLLDAVMPAHVIFPQVDPQPAGFSALWLQQVLRQQLRFDGVIFSDDLSMAGAAVAGSMLARAQCALAAGCDMLLVCNAADAVEELLQQLPPQPMSSRLPRLCHRTLPAAAVAGYATAKARVMAAFPA